MKKYENKAGNSGVEGYETGADYIIVKFKDGILYLYTDEVTGRNNVEQMKLLAAKGLGLSTFISKHVKSKYAAKQG
jgi:hypothetical protein